jgi:hypothetical protein
MAAMATIKIFEGRAGLAAEPKSVAGVRVPLWSGTHLMIDGR